MHLTALQARLQLTSKSSDRVPDRCLCTLSPTPLVTTSDTDAAQTALRTYNKLMRRNLRPIGVVAVFPSFAAIVKHDINDVTLTDHATRIPHPHRSETVDSPYQQVEAFIKTRQQSVQCELGIAKAEHNGYSKFKPDYGVAIIMGHVGTGDHIWNAVRWYKHRPQDHTVAPLKHVAGNFIVRNWSKKKSSQKRHPRSNN